MTARRTPERAVPPALLPLALWLLLAPGVAPAMSFLPDADALAPRPALAAADRRPADAVLVKKAQRRLYLLREGRVIASYRVSLGLSPAGHKQRQGDNRTPEGHYRITWRNAGSRFHRSLHLSYPNAADRARAAAAGWDPGGSIAIHGEPRRGVAASVRGLAQEADWTEGCVAVSNAAIEAIWQRVPTGTPIEIRP